jgi:hypothetical protein
MIIEGVSFRAVVSIMASASRGRSRSPVAVGDAAPVVAAGAELPIEVDVDEQVDWGSTRATIVATSVSADGFVRPM